MKISITRVHVVLLFVILFVIVGWFAPAAYASYAPQSHFIEIHDFETQDATTADDTHLVCLNRTVHQPNPGEAFTELYLVNGHTNEQIVVSSNVDKTYFEEGTLKAKVELPLGDHLEPGSYRYKLVIEMQLSQHRVVRQFTATSDTFTITESDNVTTTTTSNFSC